MGFLKNLRIETIGWFFVTILTLGGLLFTAGSVITINNISTIATTWYKFEEHRSEKAVALSALRKEIGYGGMIHQFKNLILRQDKDRAKIITAKLGGGASVLAYYRTFELGDEERKAIDNIQKMLDSYSVALLTTIDLIDQGKPPAEIYSLIEINDLAALNGLDWLEHEVGRTSTGNQHTASKSQIVANLRKALGYGGMIHNFKNMVLRSDKKLLGLVEQNITNALNIINLYEQGILSKAEQQAVGDISLVIRAYEAVLAKIEMMLDQGQSPIVIDQAVMIDDGPALRGFDMLSSEINHQNNKEAEQVNIALDFVIRVTKTGTLLALGAIFIFGAVFLWLIFNQITGPIGRMTKVMVQLAAGNMSTRVHATDHRNEIGEMARAVEVFKNTAIERHKAAQDIKQQVTELEFQRETIEKAAADYVGVIENLAFAKDEIEEKGKLLQYIIDNTGHGVVVFNHRLQLTAWNQTFIELMGFQDNVYQEGMPINDFFQINQGENEFYAQSIEEYVAELKERIGHRDECPEFHMDHMRPHGVIVNSAKKIMPDGSVITTYRDVTAERKKEERITLMALQDSLTGLANRRSFDTLLEDALQIYQQAETPFLLAYIDLDNFKAVNDTSGHGAGDLVLQFFAKTVKKNIRKSDVAIRLGGDEFAIIFYESHNAKLAMERLEKIISEIKGKKTIGGFSIDVGASAGLALCPDNGTDGERLKEAVDSALYTAKEMGKGRVCIYETDTQARQIAITRQ